MKFCNKCQSSKSESDFPKDRTKKDGLSTTCKPCKRASSDAWFARNPAYSQAYRKEYYARTRERQRALKKTYYQENRDAWRWNKLEKVYGISREQYGAMLANQGGCCGICTRAFDVIGETPRVDHAHDTGQVRGLLCSTCNCGIGYLKDNVTYLSNAITYLNAARGA